MTLQPLKDHIVAIKEQPEEKTASGLVLPRSKDREKR